MPEHTFDTDLIYNARRGWWEEPPPPPCPLGHPAVPRHFTLGWLPCGCEHRGHRTFHCLQPGHDDAGSRWTYRPALMRGCNTSARLGTPDGGVME